MFQTQVAAQLGSVSRGDAVVAPYLQSRRSATHVSFFRQYLGWF
jgi:hypothetical protein